MTTSAKAALPRASACPPAQTSRLLALYGLVFFSGALALVYEILWMRRFVTLFGATTPAAGAVLAGMFLGLCVGNWVVGHRASCFRRPVRGYGWLEIGVGLGAVLVECFLRLFDLYYPQLYQALAGHPAGFLGVKTLLVVVALFASTFCMGGTLPLLSQALTVEANHLGITVGGFYAINTAGAAIGAISVPFFWLSHFSVAGSYGVVVLGSLAIGAFAILLDRGLPSTAAPLARETRVAALPRPASVLPLGFLAPLAALSGAWIFILQISWSRMFAQVHENSIYSFSIVIAALLVGLAAGSGLARALLRRGWDARMTLGAAWILGGLIVGWTPRIFWGLTDGLAYVNAPGGWMAYGFRLVGLSLPTVLLPSLFAGMGLPFLMEMAGRGESGAAGRAIGRLIAVNTLGSILGSIAGAFLLPSSLGLWGTLLWMGVSMIVVGHLCWGRRLLRDWFGVRRLFVYGLVAACIGLGNPGQLPRTRIRTGQGERLLSLDESSHGIVAVVETGVSRRMKLNNFYVLGGTASVGDERVQGHLPLLLHPKPRRVAFLGLGTGITAGAALLHPVDRVTAIELVPEVIAAARDYFGEANLRVVGSPKVEIVSEDARNFLRGSGRRFDVIVGDLFVPWRGGESALYTLESFAAARRALAPGGLFCQWLPLFQLSEEEFNTIVATFLDVFPQATLWRGDFAPRDPAIALIGRFDDAPIDPGVVERRTRELATDDANSFLAHPAGVWIFLGGALNPQSPRFLRAPRNQENHPWLELFGPLHHAGTTGGPTSQFVGRQLEAFLQELRSEPLAATSLARLGVPQLQWREAGAELAASSILTAEGKVSEANQRLGQALLGLPPELRSALDNSERPPLPGGR
ncbi:MAG: fused MFS/spermidine synthase [Verrucomicrobia bacterium]|nr:fused MFS/spermidine synthase [Verrucomicrobiota bacterium]